MQTRGAVRDTTKLVQAAFWYKIYTAATAAAAEQRFELGLLNAGLQLLGSSLIDALPAVWAATGEADSRDVAFEAAQMRNASCLCSGAMALLAGTPSYVDAATYAATNCSGARRGAAVVACRMDVVLQQLCAILSAGPSWLTMLPTFASLDMHWQASPSWWRPRGMRRATPPTPPARRWASRRRRVTQQWPT
jgi:hypothetical protein